MVEARRAKCGEPVGQWWAWHCCRSWCWWLLLIAVIFSPAVSMLIFGQVIGSDQNHLRRFCRFDLAFLCMIYVLVYLTFVPKININCWSPHTYLRYLSNVMLHNKIVWRCGVQTSRIRVVVWPAGRVRCAGPRPMAARTTASAPRRAPATATTRARDHSAQATPETTLATVRCAELPANQIQI